MKTVIFFLLLIVASPAWGSPLSEVLRSKGETMLVQKNYPEAITLFEQSVAADPSDVRAFTLLGRAHENSGDLDKARKYYKIALRIDPTQQEALVWGALTDLRAQNINLAREKLERLRELCGECEDWKTVSEAVATWKEEPQ